MAIASVGTLGTAVNSTASSSFGFTTATNALSTDGDHGVVHFVTDNIATADGESNTHTDVSGGTGVWTKLGEYTNSPGGVAGDGVTVSAWLFRSTGTNAVGTAFTLTLSGNATDKAAVGWKFTTSAGNTLQQTGSASLITSEVNAANGFGSSAYSSLPSLSRLYLRSLGKEANVGTGTLTASTNFTAMSLIRSRNNANAVGATGEFRVNTSTGETSNPTLAIAGDTAGLFFALEEVTPSSSGTLNSTLGALTAAATGTVLVAGVLAVTLGSLVTNYSAGTKYAEDTFTDTNGTAVTAHTPTSGISSWSAVGTAAQIQSNRLRPAQSFGTSASIPAGISYPGADYEVAIDVVMNVSSSSNWVEVQGRSADAGTNYAADGYKARYDASAGQYQLRRLQGFSETSLGTYSYAIASGETHRMTLRMSGSAISLLVDGVVRVGPVTDSNITSTGIAVLRWSVNSTDLTHLEVDNFTVQSVGFGLALNATGEVTGTAANLGTLDSTLGACGGLACGLTATETSGWSEVTPAAYDPNAGSTDNFGFNGHVVRHPLAEHVFYATADYNGVFRSYDFGRTWAKISTTSPINIENGKSWFLAIAPDGSEMVIGQGNNTGNGEYKKTIKSKGNLVDLGVSWEAVSADLGFEPYGMDYDPADKTRIVATAHENDNCYVSTDGGVTFTSIGAIGSTSGAANYAYWGVSTNTIIAIVDGDNATGNGIRRATFSAGSWSSFTYVQEGRHQHGSHQLTVDRVNSQIVCPTALGYYLSTDDGATWTQVSSTPGSSAVPTAIRIYGGNSYATRGTLSSGPQLQDAPYPAATPWTSRSDPTGLTTNGPVRGASGSDGLKSSVITANWREGLWRYVEPTPLSGSLASTLGAVTAAGTGTVDIAGSVSATLGTLTSSATGTVLVSGSSNATLGAVTSTATGAVLVSGSTSATFGAATLSASGTVSSGPAINGTLDSTLGALTGAGTGVVPVAGTTAATLGAVTSTATGAVSVSGATTATLGSLTLAGTGAIGAVATGTLDATLGTLTASATGTVSGGQVTGTAALTLDPVTSVSTGAVTVSGALSATLGALAAGITGTPASVTLTGIYQPSVTLTGIYATSVTLTGVFRGE